MKKLKLYLDTSVLNFAIARDVPAEREVTLKLFQEIKEGKHEAFISDLVVLEINRAPIEIANKLKTLIDDLKVVELPTEVEAEALSNQYVEHGIIPQKHREDGLHIAIASINNLDVVVSWNFNHIVKVKTKMEVVGVNHLMGYKEIEIGTPKEVIEDVE